jgi:hypothetical protein
LHFGIDEHEDWIEIGYQGDSPLTSFVLALELGGMLWEGKDSYASVDEALQDLDAELEEILPELYGD